jgi:hypothetical protein
VEPWIELVHVLRQAVLFLIGGSGGAALFAVAQSALHVKLAMLLIGIGCSPVLMASYYIFARVYSPRIFATLAATIIGVGSVGNLAGSVPLGLGCARLWVARNAVGLGRRQCVDCNCRLHIRA